MRTRRFVALLALAGLIAAITGGVAEIEMLLPVGATVFVVGCFALAGYSFLRGERCPSGELEVDSHESAVAPHTAEQGLKRHDRGTIPR
jgi:hypothetical protein